MRASLSFYLLGPLRAQRGGALLTLRYNKARALLAWLALEPAFHTRDALADLLWPAAPTRVGRERLKRMLFHLREVLGDDVIEASRHVVHLKPNVLAWLDARDFQQRAETGRCLSGGRNTSFTRAQLDAFEQAVRLVRGPFLHGLDVADAPALEHWIDSQRESFARRTAALLRDLAHGHAQFGAWHDAIAHARRLTTLTPGDESAWQLLIRQLVESGQRDEAIIELARCRDALASSMDATPSVATLALVGRSEATQMPAIDVTAHEVRRQVTVVCCELQPAHGEDPDDLPDLLRLCRDVCATHLQRAPSYVKHAPSGDLLAYFGYPDAIEHGAQRAVATALDLLQALRAAVAGRAPHIVVRFGVHTAPVVSSARDGVPDRVGTATRVACRLASQAADGEILISDATLRLTREAFDHVPRGMLAGAGIGAYRVLRARPRVAPAVVRLIGRARELDAITQARGYFPAVFVTGDAGVGKTALIRAWLTAHGLRGVDVACEPDGMTVPLHPVRRAMNALAGDGAGWRLEPGTLPALRDRRAFDALNEWLDARAQHRQPAMVMTKEMVSRALRCAIEQAVPAGGVLWVDDLQWADTTTLEFIEELLLDPLPSGFVILSARSGFCPPWCVSNALVQQLKPLEREAGAALIDRLSGGASIEPAMRSWIASASDGVPLHIEACTREALWAYSGRAPRSAVPAELHDGLMARLDAAGDALPVAQVASAIGRVFSAALLATVCDTAPATLAPMLAALVENRVICRIDADRYAFRYALLREMAYQSQTREAREAAHRRIEAARNTYRPAPAGIDSDAASITSHDLCCPVDDD